MNELNCKEKKLLKEILLNAIGNGNTVNPKAFNPTPEQYKRLYSIMNKMELNKKIIE